MVTPPDIEAKASTFSASSLIGVIEAKLFLSPQRVEVWPRPDDLHHGRQDMALPMACRACLSSGGRGQGPKLRSGLPPAAALRSASARGTIYSTITTAGDRTTSFELSAEIYVSRHSRRLLAPLRGVAARSVLR
jgi:hypothetical protein